MLNFRDEITPEETQKTEFERSIDDFEKIVPETCRRIGFECLIDELISNLYETESSDKPKVIIGFKASAVSNMTIHWRILFLRHVLEDQSDPSNPREVDLQNLAHIKRILEIADESCIDYRDKADFEKQDENDKSPPIEKPFPVWKAELARKGLVQVFLEWLTAKGKLTLRDFMKRWHIELREAKICAKKLRNQGKVIINRWDEENTHVYLKRA